MRKLILLILMVVALPSMWLGCAGENEPDELVLIDSLTGPDTLQDGCALRYRAWYHDSETDVDTHYYWAAIEKAEDGKQVTYNQNAHHLQAPFAANQYALICELDTADDVSPTEDMYFVVHKCLADTSIGKRSQSKGRDWSNSYLDFGGFPSSCYELNIAVSADGMSVWDNECVHISETPSMPLLRAEILGADVQETAHWTLAITYNRSGRSDTTVLVETQNAFGDWEIDAALGQTIAGGKAVLHCQIVETGKEAWFTFWIRAYNPAVYTIKDYIAGLPGNMWYWVWVANHESCCQNDRSYLQFNEVGSQDCGHEGDIYQTPNASYDGGFGIYQLTKLWGDREPNIQELWDWKENVNSGTAWLNHIQVYVANDWMNDQRQQALNQMGYDVPVPDQTEGYNTFSEGTSQVIEHAVCLKAFNGAPNGHYCYWHNDSTKWKFNRVNTAGINYVYRVCSQMP